MVALCLTFGKIARLLSKAPAGKPTLYLPPSVKCVLVLVSPDHADSYCLSV